MGINITPAMKVTKTHDDKSKTEYIAFTDSIRIINKDGEIIEGIFIHLNFDKIVIALKDKTINIQISDIKDIEIIS